MRRARNRITGLPEGLHPPRIGRLLSGNRLCSMQWPDAGRAPLESGATGKVTPQLRSRTWSLNGPTNRPRLVLGGLDLHRLAHHRLSSATERESSQSGESPLSTFAWSLYSPNCRVALLERKRGVALRMVGPSPGVAGRRRLRVDECSRWRASIGSLKLSPQQRHYSAPAGVGVRSRARPA